MSPLSKHNQCARLQVHPFLMVVSHTVLSCGLCVVLNSTETERSKIVEPVSVQIKLTHENLMALDNPQRGYFP